MEVHKQQRYTASYTSTSSSATRESGLTWGTRVSVTTGKLITKKKKNTKSLALSPFLHGNKTIKWRKWS